MIDAKFRDQIMVCAKLVVNLGKPDLPRWLDQGEASAADRAQSELSVGWTGGDTRRRRCCRPLPLQAMAGGVAEDGST